MSRNEAILTAVETLGGGYVWEDEIFAVMLIDVPVKDEDAQRLCDLVGVKQIALNATQVALGTLMSIAQIPGLESLVLSNVTLTPQQIDAIASKGPEVEIVSE